MPNRNTTTGLGKPLKFCLSLAKKRPGSDMEVRGNG